MWYVNGRNFVPEISLMGRSDWSVGQCLQTSNEALAMLFTYDFQKFISSANVLAFKREIFKFLYQNKISK